MLTPVSLGPLVANPNTVSGVVAQFTDSNVNSVAGDFVASITWGDGSTSVGSVSDVAGLISVAGAHAYASAGQFVVNVSLADDAPGTAATSVQRNAFIGLPLAGVVTLTTATENVALADTSTIASFSATDTQAQASAFTATIDWGDGTSSLGTVSGANGTFTVTGGHTYADEGSYALRTTITSAQTLITLAGSVVVADHDGLTGQPVTIDAIENTPFSGVVASFSNSDSLTAASDFTAMIDWGDGATSAGTVSGGNGTFTVSGSHTYATAGALPVAVTLTDDAPGSATASATSSALVVSPAPLSLVDPVLVGAAAVIEPLVSTLINFLPIHVSVPSSPLTTSATEGVALAPGTPVAGFLDTNAADTANDFIALINWGDGSTSLGTVTLAASQTVAVVLGFGGGLSLQVSAFVVSGDHTYADEGSFPISVGIIRTTDNASGTIQGSALAPPALDQPAVATAFSVADADMLTPVSLGPLVANPNTVSGVVAQFTDTNTSNMQSDFTATIDWGDGTPLVAGSVSGGNGAFAVSGTHTYTTAGEDTITVTLADDASSTAMATAHSTADVGTVLSGHVVLNSAMEGTALESSTSVASFTSSNTSAMQADFIASIDWGDGTTSAGTVSGANGTFTVTGGHTYSDEGSFALTVTISHPADRAQITPSGNVTVAEDDELSPQGVAFTANPNQAFSGIVAGFTDTNTSNVARDFLASIDWGDGTLPTIGLVAGSNGSFSVLGTHTYATAGQDKITVSVADDFPGTVTAAVDSTAFVGAIRTGGGAQLSALEGTVLSSTVASFTDSNLLDVAGGFTATINWGDGTPATTGAVNGSMGNFTVTGTHTYADEGSDPLSVTITRTADNSLTTFAGNVVVIEGDALKALDTTLVVNPNTWLGTLTAHFSDSDASNVASDFSATIDWGDGTKTAGTLTDVNGTIAVSSSHPYGAAGQFSASVTVVDGAPGTAGVTTHASAIVDQDTSKDPAPALMITSHYVSVTPGHSVSLPITVSGFDPDDAVLVNISDIPRWLTIIDNADGKTFGPGSATLTEREVNSGLTALSTYAGSGFPVDTLRFTASNMTPGESATSTSQGITVTDPPATGQSVALLSQFIAAGFREDSAAPITTSEARVQGHEGLFLATPNHG
jgi:hypothetical protein